MAKAEPTAYSNSSEYIAANASAFARTALQQELEAMTPAALTARCEYVRRLLEAEHRRNPAQHSALWHMADLFGIDVEQF